MVVQQIGYKGIEEVLKMMNNPKGFSIYKTNKDTVVLVEGVNYGVVHLHYPKQDRLPYKAIEGKKIVTGTKIFDSLHQKAKEIDTTLWNGEKQIMCYKRHNLW